MVPRTPWMVCVVLAACGGGGGAPDSSTAIDARLGDGTHVCGLWLHGKGVCTECTIARCCSQSDACAGDDACINCVALGLQGDVLGQQTAGCFQLAAFTALTACVNDPSGCGPICDPGQGCGVVQCTSATDCEAYGCGACLGGRCQ